MAGAHDGVGRAEVVRGVDRECDAVEFTGADGVVAECGAKRVDSGLIARGEDRAGRCHGHMTGSILHWGVLV